MRGRGRDTIFIIIFITMISLFTFTIIIIADSFYDHYYIITLVVLVALAPVRRSPCFYSRDVVIPGAPLIPLRPATGLSQPLRGRGEEPVPADLVRGLRHLPEPPRVIARALQPARPHQSPGGEQNGDR